jgi:hypothetical protein
VYELRPVRILRMILLLCTIWVAKRAEGANVVLDALAAVAPSGSVNRIQVDALTTIGNDSETTTVGGSAVGTLGYRLNGSRFMASDFTFDGGLITLSDMNFRFLFGLVSVSTQNVKGTPSTLNPPAPITGSSFAGESHAVTFNQGSVVGGGQTIDFSMFPVSAVGQGTGTFQVLPLGPPANQLRLYEATLTLPVAFNEPFVFENVPIAGTVTGSLVGNGSIVLRDSFMITVAPGDFDGNGGLGCEDIDLLQVAIAQKSTDPVFDVNGDGMLNGDDYLAWITDIKQTLLGDASLDRTVDGVDFNLWNANKFTTGKGWCEGDFNGDSVVDGLDFNLWNANKFTQAADRAVVPEPVSLLTLFGLLFVTLTWRRGKSS